MKVGDRVYFKVKPERFIDCGAVEGVGTLTVVNSGFGFAVNNCDIITGTNPNPHSGGFYVDFVVLEEVYNSKLGQALR